MNKKEAQGNKKEAMELFYKELGSNLRKVRIALSKGPTEVAKMLGIKKQHLDNFESGAVRIHVFYLEKLLYIYEIKLRDVIPCSTNRMRDPKRTEREATLYYKSLVIRLNEIVKKQTKALQILNHDFINLLEPVAQNLNKFKEFSSVNKELEKDISALFEEERNLKIPGNDELPTDDLYVSEVDKIESQINDALGKLERKVEISKQKSKESA